MVTTMLERKYVYLCFSMVEARQPHGQCVRLWIRWSRFQPWLGSLCCVLRQDTLLYPGVQMGTSKCAGGNPAMDQHPIQGGVAILRRFMLRKLELSTGPMGHLDPYQRLFFFVSQCLHLNCDCSRHGTKNICTFSTAATMHEVLNSTLNNNILEPIKFPSQFN